MLPLRLGTVNANGPQDLIVYALTKNGRVEAANYRTVKLPSDMDVPLYVKNEFGDFYKAMFDHAVREARTCARCSSNMPGTWAGAIRAPPIRSATSNWSSSARAGSASDGDSRSAAAWRRAQTPT